MNTATFIRKLPSYEWRGDARLYKLDPPIKHTFNGADDCITPCVFDYVAVSAARTYSGPETYIFPATKAGKVVSLLQLPGSFTGSLDHTQALRNAGYSITEEAN